MEGTITPERPCLASVGTYVTPRFLVHGVAQKLKAVRM